MECSAAREIQDVSRNILFQSIVANFSGEMKLVSRNRVVTMAERTPRLMMARTKTTGEMLGIVENHENRIENRTKLPKEFQELSALDVAGKHYDSMKKVLVLLAVM